MRLKLAIALAALAGAAQAAVPGPSAPATTGPIKYYTPLGCVTVTASTSCSAGGLSQLVAVEQIGQGGAVIRQSGDGNRADILQSRGADQYAEINQTGDRNTAAARQLGGSNFARLVQAGDRNVAASEQSGAGAAALRAHQSGVANRLSVGQSAEAGAFAGAAVVQSGTANAMSLAQTGGNNQAVLSQVGDGNAMTATQMGDGRRLVWSQTGTNLPDLNVTQNGGGYASQLIITQTGNR